MTVEVERSAAIPFRWNMVAQSKDSGLTWMSRVHHGFANDPDPNSVLKKYKIALGEL